MTFAPDLLAGSRVAAVGPPGAEIVGRLRALGATVDGLGEPDLLGEDDAVAWVRAHAPAALLFDGRPRFGAGGASRLADTLELAWRAARAVTTGALIEAGGPGRLLFVAPPPGAGPHTDAARAALENLARTVSVEWARFQITAVALTPGAMTTDGELAELVAYVLSPAGGYLSGCRLDLGAAPVPA
ncbi:MAG TPA: hypothetical protein VIK04_11670 [Solirubrobacteraceae bacterium]